MNILIIEDDEEKLRKLEEFISMEYPSADMKFAKSFNSGLKSVIDGKNSLDVILLDMTMPNYDVSQQERGGGGPDNYAGKELLAQMCLRSIKVPTIVVTMFDSFGVEPKKVSLDKVVADLKERYSPPFRGFVYYNSAQEGWRSALRQLIDETIKGNDK